MKDKITLQTDGINNVFQDGIINIKLNKKMILLSIESSSKIEDNTINRICNSTNIKIIYDDKIIYNFDTFDKIISSYDNSGEKIIYEFMTFKEE